MSGGRFEKDLTVTVAQRPDEETIARGDENPEEGEQDGPTQKGAEKLGIRVAPVSAQAVKELGLAGNDGVLVVQVSPDGPAAGAGIRRNDVILEVNRQKVTSVDQLRDLVTKLKAGQTAILRVARGQNAQYLPVKIGGK